jgi:hypothetical protein
MLVIAIAKEARCEEVNVASFPRVQLSSRKILARGAVKSGVELNGLRDELPGAPHSGHRSGEARRS